MSDLDVMIKLSLAVLVLAVFGLANSSSDDSGTGNAKLLVSKRVSLKLNVRLKLLLTFPSSLPQKYRSRTNTWSRARTW